ncbi:MAG TPA: C1 family peptidase, partial [Minicystis sp.]|nr:C1 family peptidase [Minicystis sp.]
KAQRGEFPCGGVTVGGRSIPVLCLDDMKGHFEDAAVALLPYGAIRPKHFRLPAVVDHRLEGTESPVRAQGSAPTCSAFAFASAADHSVARWTGAPTQTSIMQIWSRYHRTAEFPAMKYNLEQPLAADAAWPYSIDEAESWMTPELCRSWHARVHCGQEPDAARVKAANARPIAEVRQIEVLRPPADVDVLRAKIAAGQDVVIGIQVGPSFARTTRARGVSYVPDYDDQRGGHYLVLTGYVTFPKGAYFLAKNSWGPQWGDDGYAWIHEATLQKNVREAYVVDAHPVDAASHSRERRVRAPGRCRAEEVPDSITGQCAPRCSDGSPRHRDVCPVVGQCPDGFVNLTGACVIAAPRTRGKHEETGIRFACGPGGCAYWVPEGQGGCAHDVCQVSCPAPDFRVAKDRHGLTCVE